MSWILGCAGAGWLVGIALSRIVGAVIGNHPPAALALGVAYLPAPPLGMASFIFGVAWAWLRPDAAKWPATLGCALVFASTAGFALYSFRFWATIHVGASIRPMGYGLYAWFSEIIVLAGGLLVSLADIIALRRPLWIGFVAGAIGIALAVLSFWIDQAIMAHFQHVRHFVFEE